MDLQKAPEDIRQLVSEFSAVPLRELQAITRLWPGYLKLNALLIRKKTNEEERVALLVKYKLVLKEIAEDALEDEDDLTSMIIVLMCLSNDKLYDIIGTFDWKTKRELGLLS